MDFARMLVVVERYTMARNERVNEEYYFKILLGCPESFEKLLPLNFGRMWPANALGKNYRFDRRGKGIADRSIL
ncbi:unnamed protein product [Haemonchus placei]|uniref:Site-specific DNA-methyltransferase (adenine-specific) n=1 Tax=Haemonchus placei TaxID=6290 RepID=A0A0N4W4A1_HAEPC|nr:unnamed protein product [Haemonchus placei]